MTLIALLGLNLALKGPVSTPYRSTEKLMARSIVGSKTSRVVYEAVDFQITAAATFENPFDSQDVSVRVTVEEPEDLRLKFPDIFLTTAREGSKGIKKLFPKLESHNGRPVSAFVSQANTV